MLNWPLCASLSSPRWTPMLEAHSQDIHVCRCYIEVERWTKVVVA